MNTARTVILLAHGARNPAWAQPFERVAEQLREAQPGLVVHLAFLELMGPSLPEVLAQVAAGGTQQVDVLPMFLGGSGHVLRDVPPLLDAARTEHGLSIRLHSAIGQQPAMVAAMARVCEQLLDEPTP